MFFAKKALLCDPKLPVKRRVHAFVRRLLCLRRRPNECWTDHTKRTGPIVARQLKKHGQPRLQTLAMRRVRIAAWQMVRCPDDAKGRRYWEESVTWRCDEKWREAHIKLSKEDYRNSTRLTVLFPTKVSLFDFKIEIHVEQYSTNLTRSLCGSSVITVKRE